MFMKAFKFAFRQTIPVLCGYLFLGLAFGLLLQEAGYNFVWAFFSSIFIYAGSMQFILVTFLSGSVSFLSVAVMTLSVNGRHIFYGLSFLERFKEMGKRYPYMIFSLTDETYSLLCGTKIPNEFNKSDVSFYMALLDHSYWIAGSTLGALLGEFIPFDMTGVDFAMTALFTVIFVEQWLAAKSHFPAILGAVSATACLIIFGADNFILPSLIVTVLGLLVWKRFSSAAKEAER